MRVLGGNLNLSRIATVSKEHHRPLIILNLLAQRDEGTPSVNETTVREIAPDSIQFRRAFPRILQVIWEADPVQGPVRVYKLYVTDT